MKGRCLLVVAAVLAGLADGSDRRPVVAVAEMQVATAAARLHYAPDGVRDVVTGELHQLDAFEVVDWGRVQSVLFRRNLEWSDLVADENKREAIRDVLLNDYLLVGTVTHYAEHVAYQSKLVKKSKRQEAEVELELLLKDAITNEVIASATGRGQASKKVSQHLGFGAGGGAVSTLSRDALRQAVEQACAQIEEQFGR